MKKITLIMITSASMLFAVPPVETTPMQQGQGMMKQGQGMKQGMQQGKKQMKSGKKCDYSKKIRKSRKQMNSPFLITQGLPHLGKMIMPYMNNPVFAVSDEQKTKLEQVKKESMAAMMKLKPEIVALREEIITAGKMGTSAELLQKKVAQLAVLQAQATMTQLKCIEETKNILTKEQLMFLLSQKKQNKKQGMKSKKCNYKKCDYNKCNRRR